MGFNFVGTELLADFACHLYLQTSFLVYWVVTYMARAGVGALV